MCVCVVCCVLCDSRVSTSIVKTPFTVCARTEVRRYNFCCTCVCDCVCACVRVRSRACAHVIFVRSCNCVGGFLLFLSCCNLLLVRAQFLWSPVTVFFFFRRCCVILLLWVRDGVWDRVVACECARAQFRERLNFVLFFFLLPLLVCYIFIVRAYVWDRVPVRALLFLWSPVIFLFF